MSAPVWVGSISIACGDFHLGVGSDDHEVLGQLEALYERARVHDPRVTANLGISMPRRSGAGPRLLPSVTHGCVSLLRSRRPARLFRRLDAELERIAALTLPPDDLVRIGLFTVVIRDGAALLVPSDFGHRSSAFERALEAEDLALAETFGTAIDLSTLEVVVRPGFAGFLPDDLEPDPLVALPGRYPLRGIVVDDERVHSGGRRGALVVLLVESIADRGGLDDQRLLDGLAELARAVPVVRVGSDDLSLDAVTGLLGR